MAIALLCGLLLATPPAVTQPRVEITDQTR